jgi:hypothetical protein
MPPGAVGRNSRVVAEARCAVPLENLDESRKSESASGDASRRWDVLTAQGTNQCKQKKPQTKSRVQIDGCRANAMMARPSSMAPICQAIYMHLLGDAFGAAACRWHFAVCYCMGACRLSGTSINLKCVSLSCWGTTRHRRAFKIAAGIPTPSPPNSPVVDVTGLSFVPAMAALLLLSLHHPVPQVSSAIVLLLGCRPYRVCGGPLVQGRWTQWPGLHEILSYTIQPIA